jgi:hypothetical protein
MKSAISMFLAMASMSAFADAPQPIQITKDDRYVQTIVRGEPARLIYESMPASSEVGTKTGGRQRRAWNAMCANYDATANQDPQEGPTTYTCYTTFILETQEIY